LGFVEDQSKGKMLITIMQVLTICNFCDFPTDFFQISVMIYTIAFYICGKIYTMYHILPITENDFECLIQLFHEFAVFEKLPEKMTNTVEQMKKEKEYFHGFVIKNEKEEILGYVTYFFSYYTWTGKSLYMDDLYIRPAYRGQGLGTMLIKKVITFAQEQHCRKLRWQVSNWNEPAIEFYKSLGAEISDIEMNCDLMF